MTGMSGMQKRAARGAVWLDGRYPGWEDRIDLGLLSPEYDEDCVLGQVTGSWARFVWKRFRLLRPGMPTPVWVAMQLLYPPAWAAFVWNIRHGFLSEPGWHDAWAHEVLDRRKRNEYKVIKRKREVVRASLEREAVRV